MDILEEKDLLGKKLYKYKINYRKDLCKGILRVRMQQTCTGLFIKAGEKKMCIVKMIIVAMVSSALTLLLHCCVIVGKESDKYWEEEQTTKKEETEE